MVQIFVTSQLIVSAVHNSRAYKSVSCFASVSSLIVQLFFFAGGSGSRISGNLTRILLVPLYSISVALHSLFMSILYMKVKGAQFASS
jgi:hypothetical protein